MFLKVRGYAQVFEMVTRYALMLLSVFEGTQVDTSDLFKDPWVRTSIFKVRGYAQVFLKVRWYA